MTSGNEKTNIDIEKFFDNETNDDLKRNFMGVYLSDSITKYLDFYDIMKQKKRKISTYNFQHRQKINQECIGGAFLIFICKKTYYYLIALVLLVLTYLLFIMTVQL